MEENKFNKTKPDYDWIYISIKALDEMCKDIELPERPKEINIGSIDDGRTET